MNSLFGELINKEVEVLVLHGKSTIVSRKGVLREASIFGKDLWILLKLEDDTIEAIPSIRIVEIMMPSKVY